MNLLRCFAICLMCFHGALEATEVDLLSIQAHFGVEVSAGPTVVNSLGKQRANSHIAPALGIGDVLSVGRDPEVTFPVIEGVPRAVVDEGVLRYIPSEQSGDNVVGVVPSDPALPKQGDDYSVGLFVISGLVVLDSSYLSSPSRIGPSMQVLPEEVVCWPFLPYQVSGFGSELKTFAKELNRWQDALSFHNRLCGCELLGASSADYSSGTAPFIMVTKQVNEA